MVYEAIMAARYVLADVRHELVDMGVPPGHVMDISDHDPRYLRALVHMHQTSADFYTGVGWPKTAAEHLEMAADLAAFLR